MWYDSVRNIVIKLSIQNQNALVITLFYGYFTPLDDDHHFLAWCASLLSRWSRSHSISHKAWVTMHYPRVTHASALCRKLAAASVLSAITHAPAVHAIHGQTAMTQSVTARAMVHAGPRASLPRLAVSAVMTGPRHYRQPGGRAPSGVHASSCTSRRGRAPGPVVFV